MAATADAASHPRPSNAYIWSVICKFAQHLPDMGRAGGEGGTVLVRLVIARDGRLLESGIAKSSGLPAFDKGMLAAIRDAAPYPPLPAEFPADQFVLIQPIGATPNAGTR